MTRRIAHSTLVLALVAGVVLGASGVSFAQEEAPSDGSTVTTEPGFTPGAEPAVEVAEPAPPESEPPWTFRFLVPTAVTLSALVLAGFAVGYGVRVKGRYRVAR